MLVICLRLGTPVRSIHSTLLPTAHLFDEIVSGSCDTRESKPSGSALISYVDSLTLSFSGSETRWHERCNRLVLQSYIRTLGITI